PGRSPGPKSDTIDLRPDCDASQLHVLSHQGSTHLHRSRAELRRGQLPEAEAARPVAWLAETARLRSIIKPASLGPEENGRRPLLSFAQMVATEHVRSRSRVPAANLLWVNTSSQC